MRIVESFTQKSRKLYYDSNTVVMVFNSYNTSDIPSFKTGTIDTGPFTLSTFYTQDTSGPKPLDKMNVLYFSIPPGWMLLTKDQDYAILKSTVGESPLTGNVEASLINSDVAFFNLDEALYLLTYTDNYTIISKEVIQRGQV